MSIVKHLFPEPEYVNLDDDSVMKYELDIHKVDDNPFYIPFGDNPTHWELTIQPLSAWQEEGEALEFGKVCDPYQFKMSRYTLAPTIEEFSKHIYDECWASIKAMELPEIKFLSDNTQFDIDHNEIEPKHVYNFMKLLHKNYEETQSFLKDYEVYHQRLYHNFKFMYGMICGQRGMFMKSFDMPIGRNFFDFLGIDIYKTNLKDPQYPDYCFPTHWDANARKKVIIIKLADIGHGSHAHIVQDEEGTKYEQFYTHIQPL